MQGTSRIECSDAREMPVKSTATARKKLVLVVEPDDLIRPLLGSWLADVGYEVVVRASCEVDGHRRPDLVILDVDRPRELGERASLLAGRFDAPIVAISARQRRSTPALPQAVHDAGVRAILAKPFSRDELLRVVADVLGA
jgi:CheY-like chemotaxis protein